MERGLTGRSDLPEWCFVAGLLFLSADFQSSDSDKGSSVDSDLTNEELWEFNHPLLF